MGGGDSVVRGYQYLMSLHMGACRGPVDALVEIRVGDRTAWPLATKVQVGQEDAGGYLVPVYETVPPPPPQTEGGLIMIDAMNLFGGQEAEGGIWGLMDVMMGDKAQPKNARIMFVLNKTLVPAYRGVVTFFFDGLIATLNPYPKPWKFRLQRAKKGWHKDDCWYPEKAAITLCDGIVAMNPAHIIYECATNPAWGRGLSRDSINEPSFVAAANRLAEECFGLCLKWSRTNGIDAFVNAVINHIGAALYPDRTTGKLTLRLIRDDYDPEELPLFTPESGLIEVTEDEGTGSESLRNEIIVKWRDPPSDNERVTRVQNIAALQMTGAISSEIIDYPGLPTAELAARVAQRDLRARGLPLRRFKIKLDRRGDKLAPAEPFRISDPSQGIQNAIVRVGRMDDSTEGDSAIIVTAIEDVFGLPEVSYTTPGGGGQIPHTFPPLPAPFYRTIEAPYGDVCRYVGPADRALLTPEIGFAIGVAAKPSNMSPGYALWSQVNAAPLERRGTAEFTPYGMVIEVKPGDTLVKFSAFSDISLVTANQALLVGNEIMRVTAVDQEERVMQVDRGCFDTIPQHHTTGTIGWAYQFFNGRDEKQYLDGDTVRYRFATRTASDELAVMDSPTSRVDMDSRLGRPYPPARVRVNDKPFWDAGTVVGDLTVTWVHRDRLIQDDRLVGHEEPTVGPEAGVTYTVRVFNGVTLLREETGITGTMYVYTDEMAEEDTAAPELVIEISAVRGSLASMQKYEINVRKLETGATGYGLDYGNSYGEA